MPPVELVKHHEEAEVCSMCVCYVYIHLIYYNIIIYIFVGIWRVLHY